MDANSNIVCLSAKGEQLWENRLAGFPDEVTKGERRRGEETRREERRGEERRGEERRGEEGREEGRGGEGRGMNLHVKRPN